MRRTLTIFSVFLTLSNVSCVSNDSSLTVRELDSNYALISTNICGDEAPMFSYSQDDNIIISYCVLENGLKIVAFKSSDKKKIREWLISDVAALAATPLIISRSKHPTLIFTYSSKEEKDIYTTVNIIALHLKNGKMEKKKLPRSGGVPYIQQNGQCFHFVNFVGTNNQAVIISENNESEPTLEDLLQKTISIDLQPSEYLSNCLVTKREGKTRYFMTFATPNIEKGQANTYGGANYYFNYRNIFAEIASNNESKLSEISKLEFVSDTVFTPVSYSINNNILNEIHGFKNGLFGKFNASGKWEESEKGDVGVRGIDPSVVYLTANKRTEMESLMLFTIVEEGYGASSKIPSYLFYLCKSNTCQKSEISIPIGYMVEPIQSGAGSFMVEQMGSDNGGNIMLRDRN